MSERDENRVIGSGAERGLNRALKIGFPKSKLGSRHYFSTVSLTVSLTVTDKLAMGLSSDCILCVSVSE